MFKTIAFLSNKLTLRGTEVALYDYADYNEKILGNKSIIITRDYEKNKNEGTIFPHFLKIFLITKSDLNCSVYCPPIGNSFPFTTTVSLLKESI
jgi:hypothetical protein